MIPTKFAELYLISFYQTWVCLVLKAIIRGKTGRDGFLILAQAACVHHACLHAPCVAWPLLLPLFALLLAQAACVRKNPT